MRLLSSDSSSNSRSIRSLLSLALVLAALAFPCPVRAACAAIPYTFTNGTSTLDATATNGNNTHFQTCVTQIDATQIGSAGLTAANLIPTTALQATFGGTQTYTFPAGISTTGSVVVGTTLIAPYVQSKAAGSTQGPVPPIFTGSSGLGQSSSFHGAVGYSVSVPTATATAVTLTGAAAFSTQSSYLCNAMIVSGTMPTSAAWAQPTSATSIALYQATGLTQFLNWICFGY